MKKWCAVLLLTIGCVSSRSDSLLTGAQWQPLANRSYVLDQDSYHLSNGELRRPYPNSASSLVVRLWPKDSVIADVDSDGQAEAVLLLTVDGGGSGVFYYAVLLRQQQGAWVQLHDAFIGDRVQLADVELTKEGARIRYRERELWRKTEQPKTITVAW